MEQSKAIANYFIQKAFDTGKEITPMKVVKLVYISHGWHLGLNGSALIDERVEAWRYGPVVESVYHAVKQYGSEQIKSLLSTLNLSGLKFSATIPVVSEDIKPFLDKIWSVYCDYTGLQLSSLTHQKGTPWDIVWNEQGGKEKEHAPIPNDLIKKHYSEKLANG